MNIRHLAGDIVDVAPQAAQAAALWLRSGFNRRFYAWYFRLQRHPGLVPMTPGVAADRPWLAGIDSVWRLDPPLGQLRYLYVFANPMDSHAYSGLPEVQSAVARCLDRLSDMGVRRVAMIHIPAAPEGRLPTREDDVASATAMIESLKSWAERNPELVDEVVLVDLRDDFGGILPAGSEGDA